jgi:hypothetical protein
MITGGCQALQDTTFLQLVVVPKLVVQLQRCAPGVREVRLESATALATVNGKMNPQRATVSTEMGRRGE